MSLTTSTPSAHYRRLRETPGNQEVDAYVWRCTQGHRADARQGISATIVQAQAHSVQCVGVVEVIGADNCPTRERVFIESSWSVNFDRQVYDARCTCGWSHPVITEEEAAEVARGHSAMTGHGRD